jgi:hypothetical protein
MEEGVLGDVVLGRDGRMVMWNKKRRASSAKERKLVNGQLEELI